MAYVRKNIWNLGGGWNETTLWYAKAVRAMREKPITDPTSWCYQAALHGFNQTLWENNGYLTPEDKLPEAIHWEQCQHKTWYFLPWHRGYVAAFESIVRDTIVRLGGPKDWALPYWNYSDTHNPNRLLLPSCFSDATMPDGTPNPLFVKQRYGSGDTPPPDGKIVLKADSVTLGALSAPDFASPVSDIAAGFGGPITTFCHYDGQDAGRLEQKPHNKVHTGIGGFQGESSGLMSDPDTAGLDPIFWVHHANIDRLWQVWLELNPDHRDPSDDNWLAGPPDIQPNKTFIMYRPDGSAYGFTPEQMRDTTASNLNYTYEPSFDPVDMVTPQTRRLLSLGVARRTSAPFTASSRAAMTKPKVELLGSNDKALALTGPAVQTDVQLDDQVQQQVQRSLSTFSLAATGPSQPDRTFLRLEGIRSRVDGIDIDVYLLWPSGSGGTDRYLVGTVALFGARKASIPNGPHGGQGLAEVFEITDVMDQLHLRQLPNPQQLKVELVPSNGVGPEHGVTVERISLYRRSE